MCLLEGGLLAGDNGAYMHTNKLRNTPTGASDDLWECPFSYFASCPLFPFEWSNWIPGGAFVKRLYMYWRMLNCPVIIL